MHGSTERGRFDGRLPMLAVTALAPLTWGTTYAVTTELLPPERPLLAGALRAVPAGLVLLVITRRLPHGSWCWRAAVLGTLNIGAFFAFLFLAAERLHGGVAATLGAVQPLIAAGLASLLLDEPLRRRIVVAGLLGMAGVAMIVLQPGAHLDAVGVVAGLAGAASMASGVTLTKKWRPDVPVLAFTSWQLLAGGLLLAVASAVVEGAPPALTGRNLIGFAWLAVAGTAIAYTLWFRGIAHLPVANVTLLALLSPLVAVTVGYVLLGQHLGLLQIVGIAVVLTALWIGQQGGPERDRPGAGQLRSPVEPVADRAAVAGQ
jgi:probable blue pigment (indigoidine) exporter